MDPTKPHIPDDDAELNSSDSDLPLGNTLQGLLSRLGTVDALRNFCGPGQTRLKQLLALIKSPSLEKRLEGLMELCGILSVSTEDSMSSFSLDAFVPALIAALNPPNTPDIMLLAARALTHLMDALPQSSVSIAHHGAAEPLCASLLAIEYIDLAEQSLMTLERLARDYPHPVLHAGGFAAALTYLEFFSIGIQRVAARLASNLCRNPPPDAILIVVDALPLLGNLLENSDPQIEEHAVKGFAALAEGFRGSSESLEKIAGERFGAMEKILGLTTGMVLTRVAPQAFVASLRYLTFSAVGSAKIAAFTLEHEGLLEFLEKLLRDPARPHRIEVLALLDSLLPSPQAASAQSKGRRKVAARLPSSSSLAVVETDRIAKLSANPTMVENFGHRFFNLLILSYDTNESMSSRRTVLSILHKYVSFAPPEILEEKLAENRAASNSPGVDDDMYFCFFLCHIMSESSNLLELESVLEILSASMSKIPSLRLRLEKEGAVQELERIAAATFAETCTASFGGDPEAVSAKAKTILEKEFSGEQGTSSKLSTLKTLAEKLTNDPSCVWLDSIAQSFDDEDGVSAFELRTSGLIDAIVGYLRVDDPTEQFERLKTMASALGDSKVFRLLVMRSLSVLALVEELPLAITEGSSGPASVSTGLRQLMRPFKLRLKKTPFDHSKGLKDYSQHVILIEPFATVSNISEFLRPRVVTGQSLADEGTKEAAPKDEEKGELKGNRAEKSESPVAQVFEPSFGDGEMDEDDEGDIYGHSSSDSFAKMNYGESLHPVEIDLDSGGGKQADKPGPSAEPPSKSYAAALKTVDKTAAVQSPASSKLEFKIDGETLQGNMSVLQCVLKFSGKHTRNASGSLLYAYRMWEDVHTLTYSFQSSDEEPEQDADSEHCSTVTTQKVHRVDSLGGVQILLPVFHMSPSLPSSIRTIVLLLRNLFWINNNAGLLTGDPSLSLMDKKTFNCGKVVSKIVRQLSDPLPLCSGMTPPWCYAICGDALFLVPFETRVLLFQSTSLGISRALQRLQTSQDAAVNSSRSNSRSPSVRLRRIERQKVRINRERILDSAMKMIELYCKRKSVLEIEYFGETGTGLGPTLEFYTLTSKEIQTYKLNLWRAKEKPPGAPASDTIIPTGKGLFPRPIAPGETKVVNYFLFLGRFCGKAVVDGRLLCLRLSEEFSALIMSCADAPKHTSTCKSQGNLTLEHLRNVDEQMFHSLDNLLKLKETAPESIGELEMTFTLPGHGDIELVPKGSKETVTADNIGKFVDSVVRYILFDGVRLQAEAFAKGFNEVVDLSSLCLFEPAEIEFLLCGTDCENWTQDYLMKAIKCDHGYDHESSAVTYLVNILSSMSTEEKRQFILFTTGSPSLPFGGLESLQPVFTVVKRTPEAGLTADASLPTVMTCSNYLKLPDYSSMEIARERILFAIREGQGSFHLS